MTYSLVRRIAALSLALAVIGLTGCDSSTGVKGEADVTLEGRVTDDAGFSKTGASQGAVVTTANVSSNGSLNQLDGETTTNAEGRFTLAVDGAIEEMVVVAQKADFESRAMVYNRSGGRVTVMPLTAESNAEADVFVEARRQDDDDDVTMTDVAVFVTSSVAGDIDAGNRSAASVATSIMAESNARSRYVREEADEERNAEARENQNEAFVELQVELHAAADTQAQAEAVDRFEAALIEAYSGANVDLETQARARTAGRAALLRIGSPSFEMEQKATLLASTVAAMAVEESFESSGASSTRLSALAQAREELVADLRAASSSNAMAEARSDYESSVEAELAAEVAVDQAELTTAATAIDSARTALEVALTTAASASAIAEAYAVFYTLAESSAAASLEGMTTKADLAARVLATLSAS